MEHQRISIEKDKISINPEDIYILLGASSGERDSYTLQLIDTYISACKEASDPQGGFVLYEAVPSSSSEEISIEKACFFTGGTINKMLRRSESYAFFVATAGYGPEELARTLISEGSYLEGYIADLVASAMAEAVAIQVHEAISTDAASKGFLSTNRYSPGYCGWEVGEQQKLFSLFPEGWCGVALSESSLMSPIKSVSGVIGTGTSVSFRDYTCELCSMKNCIFRQTRTSQG